MEEKHAEENGKILTGKLDLICIAITNPKGCDELRSEDVAESELLEFLVYPVFFLFFFPFFFVSWPSRAASVCRIALVPVKYTPRILLPYQFLEHWQRVAQGIVHQVVHTYTTACVSQFVSHPRSFLPDEVWCLLIVLSPGGHVIYPLFR